MTTRAKKRIWVRCRACRHPWFLRQTGRIRGLRLPAQCPACGARGWNTPPQEPKTTALRGARVCRCLRCEYVWTPRQDGRPVKCANPRCMTPYWDVPRRAQA